MGLASIARALLVGLFMMVAATGQVWAENAIISAEEALEQSKAGDILLLDIRTPAEWGQTGIGETAEPLTMHQKPQNFFSKLEKLTDGDKSRPVALICATGGRSEWLSKQMEKAGYSNIIDVSEGMMGNKRGAGWIKKGLPTRKP